jgi:hypothetical protein
LVLVAELYLSAALPTPASCAGCNSALEDCAVLGQVLGQLQELGGAGAALGAAAAAQYSQVRLADAHAVQALDQLASYKARAGSVQARQLPWRQRLRYRRLAAAAVAHRLVSVRLPGLLATGRGRYFDLAALLQGPDAPGYGAVMADMWAAAVGVAAAGVAAAAGLGLLALRLAVWAQA